MKVLLAVVVCLVGLKAALAQSDARNEFQPSYEVKIQFLTASNKPDGKNDLPNNLQPVVEKLRKDYLYKTFEIAETYILRMTRGGKIDVRGASSRLIEGEGGKLPIFHDWSLTDLKIANDPTGKEFLQFDSLRYSARVPLKASGATNYESTGFALMKFNLPENMPTVAGSFSMPQADEFVFVILTVKKT